MIQADNPVATGVTRTTPTGRVYDGLADKLWDRFGESYYNEIDYMADVAQGQPWHAISIRNYGRTTNHNLLSEVLRTTLNVVKTVETFFLVTMHLSRLNFGTEPRVTKGPMSRCEFKLND